jgi:5-(carboxyamino)imidazole ribonucleotide mutase
MIKCLNMNRVVIIIGSNSDLPIVKKTVETLNDFSIENKLYIASAHRTPKFLNKVIDDELQKGVKVFIAAAGGAAHLPGVIASKTHLPVIGLPIKSSDLNGVDSLYSIVQMPSDIPVATVGINRAKNAALLAIQILGVSDDSLNKKLIKFRKNQANLVISKNN